MTQMPSFQDSDNDVEIWIAIALSILILLPIPLVMFFVGREIRKVLIDWNIITPTATERKGDDGSELESESESDGKDGVETATTNGLLGMPHDVERMKSMEQEMLLENIMEIEMAGNGDVSTLRMKSTKC